MEALRRWAGIPGELAMSESKTLRLAAFASCYFAQGVPMGAPPAAHSPRLTVTRAAPPPLWLAGLMGTALPAFLLGPMAISTADVAGFRAVAALPWGLKVFVAPLMDIFMCRRFGVRRPWVMAAQSGLICALIGFGYLSSDSEGAINLTVLTILGLLVNTFSSTQDVAVDGMAISILQEEETGQACSRRPCNHLATTLQPPCRHVTTV
jgi:PAT family beta-lactamase induction signal transducer AmpG